MDDSVLIIQPDLAEREYFLSAFGGKYRIVFSEDVYQAIAISRESPHKVCILDVGSGSPRDFAELSRLKSQDRLERPIIIVTSKNTFSREKRMAASGIFYYLVRPFSIEDLREVVRGAVCHWKRSFAWTHCTAIHMYC
jgi:DNA-binding NtrC family response regulator